MRLFLSYPSEFRSQVEEVATRLRAAGHRVFFGPEDLPSGESFDDRIRRAIRQSDAFLCFLTPEFVAPGRYTLSELEIARRKWPSPTGHTLPVRARELPTETVPPYLRAVTILEPKANLAADVIAVLAGLKHRLLPSIQNAPISGERLAGATPGSAARNRAGRGSSPNGRTAPPLPTTSSLKYPVRTRDFWSTVPATLALVARRF